ncbi:MAG: peptidylprolyl isomerase [Gemmatimonadota bacterium]|nr:peptidylprolyl isomerase [Gemmatimonadota bacterium]
MTRLLPAAALAALLSAAAPARLAAQEPAAGAGAAPDTIEMVDRIVAVVGDTVILYSEILESLLQAKAQGADIPDPGTAAFDSVARESVAELVEQLVILEKAEEAGLRVPPEQLDGETDRRFQQIRNGFPSAAAFDDAIRESGRTLVQYRQFLRRQVRAQMLIQMFMNQASENLPPVSVTDEEIRAWYEENLRGETRPSTVSFEQVAIEPTPSEETKEEALERARQALSEIRAGESFEVVARRYSDDLSNRNEGGDLGWVKRSGLVREFAQAAWAARTGTAIGPVWTRFGYHIIQVENIRGGERKIRHILLRPRMDDSDVERARRLAEAIADSVRAGVTVPELAERHGIAEIPVRMPEARYENLEGTLGPEYARALADPVPGAVVGPFENRSIMQDRPVFLVLRITEFKRQGDWDLSEIREEVRERLTNDKAYERYVESLRGEVHVEVRI